MITDLSNTQDEMGKGNGKCEGCQSTNAYTYYGQSLPLLRLLEDLTSSGNSDHLYAVGHQNGKK